jgi:hypothetical protein
MENVIKIDIDQKVVENLYLEELKKRLDQADKTRTLWDMKELCRQASMSENTIKERFFYEEGFPKYKIGGKWYMVARETEEFLLQWVRDHSSR